MRIKGLWKNIEADELQPHELKNCDVVIDGQNYFYNMYPKSDLPFKLGCESDKYAQYLREQLSIFKKANVKCYFIFKGGRGDNTRKIEKFKTDLLGLYESTFVRPVFMKEVYIEVLDEMNFNYVICEFECKKQCIALAQKLNCPIISFDVKYCFSGVPYIPKPLNPNSFRYDDMSTSIHCSLFSYEDFVRKYNLNKEKLATFIVLTDENIYPENYFQNVYRRINIKKYGFLRNRDLLQWLTSRPNDTIAKILQMSLKPEEIANFATEKNKVMEFICRKETPEIPFVYLMQENRLDFDSGDPLWFQKGVACGYVALQYVKIYRYNTVSGSCCIEDTEAEDAMFLSLDIIKYAYNLLTNFERSELQFHNNKGEIVSVNVADATAIIPKPSYTAEQSPFENGWAQIRALKLFEHFLEYSMPAYNFDRFNDLPEDVRLLMIAVVYFTQNKSENTTVAVCSVLLSYVMLEVVAAKCNNNVPFDNKLVPMPILDPITDKEQVTELDSNLAVAALTRYFTVSTSELNAIDYEMLHPLVEFQHCLQQLNFLNKLCGAPYRPTTYSRTYNGTFVYKVAHAINAQYSGNVIDFVEKHLSPAPTVLAFFNGLKEIYEEYCRPLSKKRLTPNSSFRTSKRQKT